MVAKSYIRGHEVSWNDRLMQWEFKNSSIPTTIPSEDISEEWFGICSEKAPEKDTDSERNEINKNTSSIVQKEDWRPCVKCGKLPNKNGDDYCIQNLGKVINACCGHGKNKGYIMFDDGRVIEGYFTVKNTQKNLEVK